MPDIGDTVPATLTVSPADGTTTATATARLLPSGVAAAIDTTPNTARDTWTAAVEITALGAYRVTWTVTGTGEGTEHDTIYALGGPDPPAGESYATLADLALWTGSEPDAATAGRYLVRASRLVDQLLIGAVYDVDDDGMPTTAADIAALRDAACAQAEWIDDTGDPNGSAGQYGSVSIGNVSIGKSTGASSGTASASRYAPDAVNTLRLAGLLPLNPWTFG